MDGKSVDVKTDSKYNEQYIVCYLDILGYKELVDKMEVESTETAIKDSFAEVENWMSRLKENEQYKTLVEEIKIDIMSDSIIIRRPLCEFKEIKDHNLNESKTQYFVAFFIFVRVFYLSLIGKLGYFLRGGIEIEQHYESSIPSKLGAGSSLFIFSKCLIMSSQLENSEKEKPKIRVLVGDSVIEYIKEIDSGNIPSNLAEEFCIDEDGLRYLDIYTAFKRSEYHKYKKLIQDIIKALKDQIREHRVDEKVMGKYLYFVNYHNERIKTLNLPMELIINPFEEI